MTTGPEKDTQAFCPDGKVVLGTGGAVGATRQGAVLREVQPWPPSNHVHVSAGVYSGSPPSNFAVFAAAICANEPPGYDATDQNRFVTGDIATVSATCGGRIMLSGGASGTGFDNDIGYLISMYPNLFVYRVQARKAPDARAEWLVRFWTICVD